MTSDRYFVIASEANPWGGKGRMDCFASLAMTVADAAYFRKTREARFGKPLEDVVAGREKSVEGFRRSLDPLRLTLKTQPYLGGEKPNYADYIVFGPFQWARVVSPFKLLADNDPVHAWREKLLDAFDGMARQSPGHPV